LAIIRRTILGKRKRLPWWPPFALAGVAVALGISGNWLLLHRTDPDFTAALVGFSVAWIPFVVSLAIAYMADLKGAHWAIRWGIVACGLIWSVLAWKDKSLSLESSRQQQTTIMEAFNQANIHTDQAVGKANEKANRHTDEQVASVRDDLKSASKHSDEQISTLREDVKAVGAGLGSSISKIGKPDPPVPSKLEFTLWSDDARPLHPVLASAVRADKDGIFTVDFTIGNTSQTAAHSADVWIDICIKCSFAKEPSGLDRPSGMRDQTRHLQIGLLNPGTSLQKQSVAVKLLDPQLIFFEVGMRYSCEVCVKAAETQSARITVLPSLP
jgi:hypothetical protein